MGRMTTDEAWTALFHKYGILEKLAVRPYVEITSGQINEFRESRLMAKFDSSVQRPALFREHNLSILPVTRGSYVIGRFDAYSPLSYPATPPLPIIAPCCQSLDCANLYSEASALAFAFHSGIITNIMDDENVLHTVSGRMASGSFDFHIRAPQSMPGPSCRIPVCNAQLEIDGGYEGNRVFCLVEAKNVAPADFMVRQLYYPYRLWRNKVTKPVIPVFLVFSNDVFTAFRYDFRDPDHYNSLELVDIQRYIVADRPILFADLVRAWRDAEPREPGVTFPQADSFERVIDLLSLLVERPLSRQETTARYVFDPRQTNYYTDACRYLGLLEKFEENGTAMYRLSPHAEMLMKAGHRDKAIGLVKLLFATPVFHAMFRRYLESGEPVDRNSGILALQEAPLFTPLGDTTIGRRASTATNWMRWILAQAADGPAS